MPKVTGVRRSRTKEVLYEWSASCQGVRKDGYGYVSQAAARADRDAWLNEQRERHGRVVSKVPTLAQFWIESHRPQQLARVADGDLRSSSLNQYELIYRTHIEPKLGHRRLNEIDVQEVEEFIATLPRPSAKGIVSALSQALDLALRWRLISYNPTKDARTPRPKPRRTAIPTLDDARALADLAKPADRALILLLLYTGCRSGELLGLHWSEVDLDGATLRIIQQNYRGEIVDMTKTRAGMREDPICRRAVEVLREHRRESATVAGPVFTTTYNRLHKYVWCPLRKQVGLPDFQLHKGLRSLYNSHIRATGLPPSITKLLLGHVDDRVHDDYTQIPPEWEARVREALEQAFG